MGIKIDPNLLALLRIADKNEDKEIKGNDEISLFKESKDLFVTDANRESFNSIWDELSTNGSYKIDDNIDVVEITTNGEQGTVEPGPKPEVDLTRTPVLTEKQKEKIQDEVADAVKELSKSGKDIEGIREGLLKKFAAIYTQEDLALRDESGNILRDDRHRIKLIPGYEVGDLILDDKGNMQIKPEYREAIAEVDKIFNLIQANDGNKNKVKAAFDGKWTSFDKKLFKSLDDVEEATEVSDNYKKYVAGYREAFVKNNAEQLKTNPNFVPDYEGYVKTVSEKLETEVTDKNLRKQLIKELKEDAQKDAYARAVEILPSMTGESKMAIRKEMRALSEDSYFRDAIQDLKRDRKIFARHNKVENRNLNGDNSDVRRDDLQSDLRKKFLGIKTGGGEALADKLDVYKTGTDANGENIYDLVALSDDVVSRVGFDYFLNRNDDDLEMSELKNLKQHLQYKTNRELTDNEVKRLAKYVKVEIEGRDRSFKAILDKLFMGIPSLVSGAVGGFIAKHGNLEITQAVNITVKQDSASSILSDLDKAGVKYDKVVKDQTVEIHILQQVIKNDRVLNAIMGGIAGAGIGAIPTLALLAFGDDKNEKSCVSVSDYSIHEKKYTDLESYKRYVDQRYGHNKVKAEAMKHLAQLCYDQEGERWHEVYNDLIREMAGYGSKLNPEECIGFKYFKPKTQPKPKPNDEYYDIEDECTEEKVEVKPVEHKTVKGVAWQTMAARYSCIDDYLDPKQRGASTYKVRMMKVMQAVTNNDYSLENLKKLTDLSLQAGLNEAKIRAAFSRVAGFDVDIYIQNLRANVIGKQKIPAITINENTTCDYDGTIRHNVKFTRGKKVTGISGYTGDSRVCRADGSTTVTVRRSNGTSWTGSTTNANRIISGLDRSGVRRNNVNTNCYTPPTK